VRSVQRPIADRPLVVTLDLSPPTSDPLSRLADALGPLFLLLAALSGAILFLPPQGRIGAPLHDAITMFFGPATFVLPLALAFVGVLLIVRRVRPGTVLPARRLSGVFLVTIGVVAAEHLLGGSSLLGAWLTTWLVDSIGPLPTVIIVVGLVAAGTWLAFDLRLPVRKSSADAPAR
jgi:hypothetical protein